MNTAGRLTTATLASLCAVAVGLVFASAPALAKSHIFSESFGSAGTGNGDFTEPYGVAVNETTHKVYVVDRGNDRVEYFSSSGAYEGQFNGKHAPAGPFSGPTAVAVDQSNGDVWVADSGHNVVDEFTEAGVYVTGSQLTGPSASAPINNEAFLDPEGLAVDPANGDLYVADHEHRIVDDFEPSGPWIAQFEPEDKPWSLAIDSNSNVYVAEAGGSQAEEFTALGASHLRSFFSSSETAGEAPRAVAVDVSDDDVYFAANAYENAVIEEEGGSVDVYGSSGTLIESFGAGSFGAAGVAHPLRGIAVDSSSHTVYVANTANDDVNIFIQVEGPTATTEEPATEVTATSATLPGDVNPNEAPLTECLFEYGTGASYGQSKTCTQTLAEIGSGNAPKAVSAHLTGLIPNDTYHYQLFAANASAPGKGGEETFKTEAALPTVNDRSPVVNATRTTARLSGTVNPENSSTTYHFEYGTTTAYGSKTEEANAGAGYGDVSVRPQEIVELQPDTTYHYRLVATNEAGIEPGPDYTFTTAPRMLPLVNTGEASGVTQTDATISGTVTPQGIETSYAFEIGTDTSYNGAEVFGNAGVGEGAEPIAAALTDLAPGTTYNYRLTATNAYGMSYGQNMTFTTPGIPSPIGQPLSPPWLATPDIAFPTESQASTGATKTKKLTNAQKLANALKVCRKEAKHKRAKCERQARTKYAPAKSGAKKKKNTPINTNRA
jgi:DNA-binding beta-propeller fold protein YncE